MESSRYERKTLTISSVEGDYKFTSSSRKNLFQGFEILIGSDEKNEVIFPILGKVKDNKNTLELRTKINYLACNDVCIPYTAKINLDIPPGAITQYITSNRTLINKYMSKIPIKGEHHKLRVIRSNLVGSLLQTGEDIREGFIEIEVENNRPFDKPEIYLEGPESILFGSPQITLNSSRTLAKIRVPPLVPGFTKKSDNSLTLLIRTSANAPCLSP